MRFLRTNTAVRLTVGPFLDRTDGITPETALTATNEKITFMVDDSNVPTLVIDANATASGGNNDFVHVTGDDAGFYDLELTAAQTNYLGRAMLAITYATDHCPVFHEFMIVPAMIYDSLILGTDRLDANVTHFGGTAGTFSSGRPEVNASHLGGTSVNSVSMPGQGAPSATPNLMQAIMYLYKAWRNRKTQSSSQYSLYADDATTVDHKATVSADATSADIGEVASGP